MRTENPDTLRQLLRGATQAAHARLDAASAHFDLRVRESYARFLLAQAAALLPMEVMIECHAGGIIDDWPQRRRTGAMLGDLALLGVTPPPAVAVHPVDRPAWMLGVLYVLEGSRLGGKILRRRVLEGDDGICRSAVAYLGHGAAQKLWPSFLVQLEGSGGAHADPEMLVNGANAAFAAFELAAGSTAAMGGSMHAAAA